jgi:hypothetical protein
MQALLLQRIAKSTDDMLLSDEFSKRFGAPLAGEYLGHSGIVGNSSFVENSILRRIAALSTNDFTPA